MSYMSSPLADRMRPRNLQEYIGQEHLLAPDKLLRKTLDNKQLFSIIFWGPPGVGKTTLARILAQEVEAEFIEFSAVATGIADIKKIFEEKSRKQLGLLDKAQTIIFIDEIHRFNKAQQDAFLPYVESGLITLIGATTENPSFEVISPLLSRTRVLVLNSLTEEELSTIIDHALTDKERGLGLKKTSLAKQAKKLLIEMSGGDARGMLNTLEIAAGLAGHPGVPLSGTIGSNTDSIATLQNDKITVTEIEEAFQKKALSYDKAGEEHYNTISAFIKSIRASNVDAALYYLARMVEAGEDPLFIARRMVIFASEDIGLAVPTALVLANEVFRACEVIGYPECQINLAHGVAYLAQCKKNRSSYDAYFQAVEDVKKYGNLPIPMNLRNAPTKLMKEVGYGKGYEMYSKDSLLPDKIKDKKYLKS